jgi:hypothetical protein
VGRGTRPTKDRYIDRWCVSQLDTPYDYMASDAHNSVEEFCAPDAVGAQNPPGSFAHLRENAEKQQNSWGEEFCAPTVNVEQFQYRCPAT